MPKTIADIQKKLWSAADSLRKNIDAAEYKHIVLGLIFLKYISDSFEALHSKLKKDKQANPEDWIALKKWTQVKELFIYCQVYFFKFYRAFIA